MRSPGFISRRSARIAAVMVSALVVFGPRPARAVFECGGVQDTCNCGTNNFCICCEWSGLSGNCVWYGWHKACCIWGIGLQWCTDAHTWDSYAQQNGYPVRTAEPCAETVFVCEQNTTQCASGGYGHVGWVTTAYPDGSIDVEEQGCYSWDGVRTRNIAAQNASPAMKYIYKPGTSCTPCECDAGDTEQQNCGDCGTQTRSCDGCNWGSWSACSGPDPGGGNQPCDTGLLGVCRDGVQRCVNGWIQCEQVTQSQPEACGDGLDNDCDGDTDEGCAGVDASPPDPDGAGPGPDGGQTPDGGTPNPDPDGGAGDPDGSGPQAGNGDRIVGGCSCDAAGSDGPRRPPSPVFVILCMLGAAFWVRRFRDKKHN